MKSALLEWETGSFAEEEKLLKEGIGKFPEYAKLYMMLGSFYESSGKVEEARDTYRYDFWTDMTNRKGLLKCPFSVPLWLLYVELERKNTSVMKARSLLEIARQKCPQNEDLWIRSITWSEPRETTRWPINCWRKRGKRCREAAGFGRSRSQQSQRFSAVCTSRRH